MSKPDKDLNEKSSANFNEKVDRAVRQTVDTEAQSVRNLANDDTVAGIKNAIDAISGNDGTVAVTGVGKSGDVGKKILATLNSIGVTSQFIHPVEALHGDMGIISDSDTILLISNSGNTDEVLRFFRHIGHFNPETVAITSNPESKLAQKCDYIINTHVSEEGAVLGMVPMASATATMVVGDCIANGLMVENAFDKTEYGHFHPGGTIGKRLLLEVNDILNEDIPCTSLDDTLAEVALKIGDGGKGIAVIQDDRSRVKGIITDGDLRRIINRGVDLQTTTAHEVMTEDPITVSPETSAIDTLELIEKEDITQLVVVDEDNIFAGVVHIHDIMKEGLSMSATDD